MRRYFFALISAVLLIVATPSPADEYALPNLGTAGILGMTVERERQIGEYFLRQARSALPLIEDPVMNEYLKSVGGKLVMSASGVRFPFTFLTVNNPTLNASAFIGGALEVNTGLYHYAKTEDQFASVLAHEISHITQRHIARFIEEQSRGSTLTIAGIIGSLVMSIINPSIGMAALSTTMGASVQSGINFTRENEYEADRVGIALLSRAGFNPYGMVEMFNELLNQQGNINPAFAMLIDHPLSAIRVSEAQSRAAQLGQRKNSSNVNYDLARARADVRYMGVRDLEALKQSIKLNPQKNSESYVNYALALICYELKQYGEAQEYLNRLTDLTSNIFILDLKTDLDIAQKHYNTAISRLEPYYRKSPGNEALALNLANAYKSAGRNAEAVKLLKNFLVRSPDNLSALSLLAESAFNLHDRCEGLQARGALFALKGAYPQSLHAYSQAMNYCSGSYSRDIIRALTLRVSEQRNFDDAIKSEIR